MRDGLAGLLSPRSVALVGCPGDLARPGARPLVFLRKHGFPGAIYPVNPRYREIAGMRAYPSVEALPERPDVVWIGLPGGEVEGALASAARLGVRYAIILSAGFGETDAAGRERERRLRALAEAAGMTVLGPNMLGYINCWDRVALTWSPAGGLDELIPGGLGIASQSGALGGVVVNRAFDRRIGVSVMVSTGNELGVSVADCLEYFAADPRTRAVALVAEGIRDGARFRRAAEALLHAGKPLVALKVGRSAAGRRNALTHTGALAGSHTAWRAVARQLGIVDVDTFEELVEIGGYLSRGQRPVRRGVAVVTTSGGASIMTADHLEAQGVRLPRLGAKTLVSLGERLPGYALTRDNPVDVTAGLSEDLFREVLATLAAEPRVDGVVATVSGARGPERARNIAAVAAAAAVPIVACWIGGSLTEEGVPVLDRAGVPCFRNPRTLALALAAGRAVARARAAYGRARRPIPPGGAAVGPPRTLGWREVACRAEEAGVPLAPWRLVAEPAAAVRAARAVGLPVALKLVGSALAHKTESRALALGLESPVRVLAAARALLARARGRRGSGGPSRGRGIEGLLVQRMVSGVEVLVGITRDATFGPMLVVGAGGVAAELLGDVTARPLPVTRREIRAMLAEPRTLGLLDGFRGAPPADVDALVDAILALVRLAGAAGERLVSLEANPIMVGARGRGALVVDLLAVSSGTSPAVEVPAALD